MVTGDWFRSLSLALRNSPGEGIVPPHMRSQTVACGATQN